ncbi:MAG: prenyltransferase/squalene oxidase repeat-containing protein, partial [Armatimonadota bacterium]
MSPALSRLDAAIDLARRHLLSLRAGAYWEGHLSSSAVSTAVATLALAVAGDERDHTAVRRGTAWLVGDQNHDGGWGDTPDSPSNLAATLLAICALTACHAGGEEALARAREHLAGALGVTSAGIADAVHRRYGTDRTFAAPILATCALAGLVSWSEVPALPFELAMLPRSLHRRAGLQVVSYALPALIAVGAVTHRRSPARNPLVRAIRRWSLSPALRLLPRLQPDGGGFLEAAPLTAFVALCLEPVTGPHHEVVRGCLSFLRRTVRPDGSWPIDTNLSVWVTTNALSALRHSGGIPLDVGERARLWLLECQHAQAHPFTGAEPGGWAWTHLPGGVPDADDTAGAVIAMAGMGEHDAAMRGAMWLVQLRNADGGWPTFCRGWGRLPFDRSSPDITAHALRAVATLAELAAPNAAHIARLVAVNVSRFAGFAFRYLEASQREDGSWVPLWFGNQYAPGQRNLVYGTARVLAAYADCGRADDAAAARGVGYLLRAQNPDGGWGGAEGVDSSVEETALAVSALSRFGSSPGVREAVMDGTGYLLARLEDGSWTEPAPIGLYFASLWYSESLYPVAWGLEALARARDALAGERAGAEPSSP